MRVSRYLTKGTGGIDEEDLQRRAREIAAIGSSVFVEGAGAGDTTLEESPPHSGLSQG